MDFENKLTKQTNALTKSTAFEYADDAALRYDALLTKSTNARAAGSVGYQ